ncbi:MAG: hypothetical protein QOD26_3887 [Betaproteobacteria bacterium]|jgi:CheY-like chemotaxis protein|nr:hypothetical protein [Betaproteobacteria bacterium]
MAIMARALPKPGPKRCRLLYIEDRAESVALVEKLLANRKDLLLMQAADVNLGIESARLQVPEVILVNIDLPGPAGPAPLLKLLRTEPALATTPILALSADARPEAVVNGLQAGFFQYLAQPLQAGPFMEALEFALEFAAVERSEDNPVPLRRRKEKESR